MSVDQIALLETVIRDVDLLMALAGLGSSENDQRPRRQHVSAATFLVAIRTLVRCLGLDPESFASLARGPAFAATSPSRKARHRLGGR